MSVVDRLDETVAVIEQRRGAGATKPAVGLILGSGLGAFADTLTDLVKLPYSELPHLPTSHVIGHAGNLCFGRVGDVPVVCMQGRIHLYEGHAVRGRRPRRAHHGPARGTHGAGDQRRPAVSFPSGPRAISCASPII